jgi:hypothetical protein
MQSLLLSQTSNLEELIGNIFLSGSLSAAEYKWLSALSTSKMAYDAEKVLIERILYGVRHGLLTVAGSA